MFIRTERLFLRPSWPDDLNDLLDALGEDALRRTVDVSGLPASAEGLRAYLAQPRDPRLPHFFMYLRGTEGARLVGGIGLGRHDDDVEVGYWIAAGYRGRGYALEALVAVIEHARTLGHRRLVARHFADGKASMRVLAAAGFRDTGSDRPRFSAGRGEEALARLFVVDLASPLRLTQPDTGAGAAMGA